MEYLWVVALALVIITGILGVIGRIVWQRALILIGCIVVAYLVITVLVGSA